METLLKKVTENDTEILNSASEIIKNGGLVAFPTETVYGLGANGLDKDAVKKIFIAKGRPNDNPLILHISDISQVNPLVKEISPCAKILMDKFWPGPMTLIFKKSDLVPYETSGGLDTVAIRFPENKIAQKLIALSSLPVAAPSANTSGRPSPTKASHVFEDMCGKIPMVLDGGPCNIGLESTVIDTTKTNPIICRPGGITLEQIKEFFPLASYDAHLLSGQGKDFRPISPGMKYKHYAPKGELFIVKGKTENVIDFIKDNYTEKTGIITFDEYSILNIAEEFSLGSIYSPADCSQKLFDILRTFDSLGVTKIYSLCPSDEGVGFALCNRLFKASGGKFINV